MNFPSIPDEGDLFGGITFSAVDVHLPDIDITVISNWLSAVAKTYGRSIRSLSYVLCSDAYLIEMNVERLNHDTYTDIITFDLCDNEPNIIEGECYISLERVKENAQIFNVSSVDELRRVLVHGLLHLCGLGDKSDAESIVMREAEELALNMLKV